MKYGSVCSGIEAASVAWHPLGWSASFLSEIEKFPREVLAHHYPNTPLHGDFTTIQKDDYEPIELLVGGTPCQSFSVAGLRAGLNDPRGNLMLEFGALAKRLQPKWLVWENVPGVLSSNGGRDFGSFLAMLGELGYGFAYRVLDAQYFGVPQRRRRVFVIGCLGDFGSAAAVLFERHSLQGDIAPSREKGQRAAPTLDVRAGRSGETSFHTSGGLVSMPTIIDRAAFNQGANALYEPLIEQSETMPTIVARAHVPAIAYGIAGNIIGRQPENGGNGNGFCADVSYTLTKTDRHGVVTPTLCSNGDAHSGFRDEHGLVANQMQVRRLMPIECERLQGFPDNYSQVPHRGKPAADGPRYKALGNSWAVPNIRWIGERIQMVDDLFGVCNG